MVEGGLPSDGLQLFTRLVNIGDVFAGHASRIDHSPATVARRVGQDRVAEDTVRLSIGIEYIDDLLADLEQAPVGI